MRKLTLAGSIFVALAAFFAGGVPVFGEGTDSVAVTASVQADACITVGTSNINYTTAPFSSGSTMVTRSSQVANITSCASVSQDLLARGTDATGTNINWALTSNTSTCTGGLPINQFRHNIITVSGTPISVNLSTTDQSLGTLIVSQSVAGLDTQFTMPCTGSGGAGQTANTSIVFTATVPS